MPEWIRRFDMKIIFSVDDFFGKVPEATHSKGMATAISTSGGSIFGEKI